MKHSDEQMWWKYIDDECTEEERKMMKQLLEDDPSAKEAFMLRNALHQNLTKGELLEPSFNFTNKVMDALPPPEYIVKTTPIISPLGHKIFWVLISLLLLSVIVLLWRTEPGTTSAYSVYLKEINQFIIDSCSWIPVPVLQTLVMLFITSITLLGLDALMKRRFQKV